MKNLKRGMVIDVQLDPTLGAERRKTRPCIVVTNDDYNARSPVIQVVPVTAWSEKKSRIITNIEIDVSAENGLTKKSVADCLQTRPIDYRHRMVGVRGKVDATTMRKIGKALKLVFDLE